MNRNSDGTATRVDMIDAALTAEFGTKYTYLDARTRSELIIDVNTILRDDLDAFDPTNATSLADNIPLAVHTLRGRIGSGGLSLSTYAAGLAFGRSSRGR